jgi:hypothetical protein
MELSIELNCSDLDVEKVAKVLAAYAQQDAHLPMAWDGND